MRRKGTPFPHLQFMTQSVPPTQIVIMLGKGIRLLSGAQTWIVSQPLILHFNHWKHNMNTGLYTVWDWEGQSSIEISRVLFVYKKNVQPAREPGHRQSDILYDVARHCSVGSGADRAPGVNAFWHTLKMRLVTTTLVVLCDRFRILTSQICVYYCIIVNILTIL